MNEITNEIAKILVGGGTDVRSAGEGAAASYAALIGGASSESASTAEPADSGASRIPEALAQNTSQLLQLQSVIQSQVDTLSENTRAVADNTTTIGRSVLEKAGSALGSMGGMLGGGFTLAPVVSGLMKLFGGGDDQPEPAPVTRYTKPEALRIEAAVTDRGTSGFDYGQNDRLRTVAAAPQITVQVSAMDSRSFLDHSDDIARAVKQAMLESNALNDVVAEL